MRIAVFGGAFDPPHLGHQQLVKYVLSSGVVDAVWLMPNFESTWKKTVAKPEDRLKMCQILTSEFPQESVKVSPLEIEMAGKSYTLATVKELKKRYPDTNFYWLIGSELVETLPKWEKAEGLFKEINFLVFPRTRLSSTEIRKRIEDGLPITGLVPKDVEQYIREHKLYV